jgi:hypothetical protein
MALLYGRAGCLTAENGGFRPGQVAARPYMLHALGRELRAAGRLAAPPG